MKGMALALLLVAQAPFDLDRLMATLAAVTERNDPFTETRTDPLLGTPLVSAGRLLWTAPDRVEKITDTPAPERFLLEGRTVTLTRPGEKPRSLPLAADPRLMALTGSLRATLAGDRRGLERSFALALAGDAQGWTLTLTPRYQSLKEAVTAVVFTGRGGAIDTVTTTDGGGGRAVMRVAPR